MYNTYAQGAGPELQLSKSALKCINIQFRNTFEFIYIHPSWLKTHPISTGVFLC